MSREPIFNIPGAILALLGILVAVHVGRGFLAPETDEWFVLAMALIPARYTGLAMELPGGTIAEFTSPVSHMLVHGDAMHLAFNALWLAAFGSAVALRVGALRVIIFTIICGLFGAALFVAVNPGLLAPVVGASGAVSGLMGAAMRILHSAMVTGELRRMRNDPRAIPLLPLASFVRDPRMQLATALWVLLNLAAMIGLRFDGGEAQIAWEAHIGGYLAGVLLFGAFDFANAKERTAKPNLN